MRRSSAFALALAAPLLLACAAAADDVILLTTADGIGPGALLVTTMPGATKMCTANFVWSNGTTLFLGTAGHCVLPDAATATHGAGANYPARLSRASVCISECRFGGNLVGTLPGVYAPLGALAYARQSGPTPDGYDFAIIEIPAALASEVRPAMPVWGGPTSVGDMIPGEPVCHYGAGIVFGETFPTMARAGLAERSEDGAWSARIASAFGDSGSALVTCAPGGANGLQGIAAAGILTALNADDGTVVGTTVERARELALEATLTIHVVTVDS